jgi:tRNA 2-thiocytidine biosynthesis protein TtcA
MLAQWDKEFPGRVESIYNAMQNIHPSHMLDRNIFDFHSLVSEQMKANGVNK